MAAQQKKVYLITGASRGLGAELTSQLLQRGQARVLAGARSPAKSPILQRLTQEFPDDLHLLTLDVTDEQGIKAAAEAAKSLCPHGIDVLVNNAGIAGSEGVKMALDQSAEDLLDVFKTNVVGARLVSAHFLPLLKHGKSKQIFNMSSGGGSCAVNTGLVTVGPDHPWACHKGRFASYAVSKAALNMETICEAQQLYAEGFTVIAIHPGWSDTEAGVAVAEELASVNATLSAQPDSGKAPSDGAEALKHGGSSGPKPSLTVAESIAAVLAVMDKVTLEDTAKFLNWQGEVVPW